MTVHSSLWDTTDAIYRLLDKEEVALASDQANYKLGHTGEVKLSSQVQMQQQQQLT